MLGFNIQCKNVQSALKFEIISLATFSRHMMGMYTDLLFLLTSLLFWHISRSFAQLLQDDQIDNNIFGQPTLVLRKPTNSWKEIGRHYKILRKLSVLMNEVISTLVTFVLLEFLFYFAIELDEFLVEGKEDWQSRILSVFWFIELCVILYFPADACYQVQMKK